MHSKGRLCNLHVNNYFDNAIVSVIIPVYNSEKYIAKTLDSVLLQTYKCIEIILVDDCSTDNSQQKIATYLQKHPNITYHRLATNAGAGVVRNKAIALAKGRYIAFLDSDDLWYPQKIEKQIALMQQGENAICYTAIEMIDENDQLIKGKRDVLEKLDYKSQLRNTMLATSAIVVDRLVTGDFTMPVTRIGEDYATWLFLLRNGRQACGINEALVQYRRCSQSLSSNKLKSIQTVWHIQVKHERINPFCATYNVICYAYNAFKKHYI
ncbi:MAG: glycosyltransferase family 2 protein [Hyphomonadaceae bacterium]|nr:glycosyltransferase family 2 protein [Clostridia bacterium]